MRQAVIKLGARGGTLERCSGQDNAERGSKSCALSPPLMLTRNLTREPFYEIALRLGAKEDGLGRGGVCQTSRAPATHGCKLAEAEIPRFLFFFLLSPRESGI